MKVNSYLEPCDSFCLLYSKDGLSNDLLPEDFEELPEWRKYLVKNHQIYAILVSSYRNLYPHSK